MPGGDAFAGAAAASLAARADAVLAALADLAPPGALDGLHGAHLLVERAAIRGGAAGTCRLLAAADGWLAVNLPRPDDWDSLPAWLECDGPIDWGRLALRVRTRPVAALVERARLLGLAVAPDQPPRPAPWCSFAAMRHQGAPGCGTARRSRSGPARPIVIDLSSLWAGPLCGHLLRRLGAEVIKVESTLRPDGARHGPSTFFDLLNAGKASVALPLHTATGRTILQQLLQRADIVIEASRPRALRQLGIDAEALVRDCGTTWVSITGYGRAAPQEDWIAYGDDAAVAAGLSHAEFAATGVRRIVGDAIADPLTGLHAALAAWTVWRGGGGRLVSLALCDVVRNALTERWSRGAMQGSTSGPDRHPGTRLRRPDGLARPLGADTAAVLGALGIAA